MGRTVPNMIAGLPRAIDFIKAHQNPDGGWGYRPGGMSFVEPTAFSLMALRAEGRTAAVPAGLSFLRTCQKDNGALGLDPQAAGGSWMSYAALLAFHGLGADAEERRLRAWVLGFEDASGRFTKEQIAAIAQIYRYDATIPGWSWTPGTTAWVEPTALFIIALRATGVPASEKRVRSGIDLLLDRRVPSGGWNFGNPFSKSYELEASAMSTALALAALGAAGVSGSQPAVGAGLHFLEGRLQHDVSTASLAWTGLALRAFRAGARLVSGVLSRLAGLQRPDGSFRGNPFETALAYLVLTKDPILAASPGDSR